MSDLPTLYRIISDDTPEPTMEHVKTFTDEQLQALSNAPTTPAKFLAQVCADAEIILREAGLR